MLVCLLQRRLNNILPIFASEDFHNFMGHKYRVVAVRYFPYIDYKTDTAEPGSTVTPKDSIDFRILTTLAAALNFT